MTIVLEALGCGKYKTFSQLLILNQIGNVFMGWQQKS